MPNVRLRTIINQDNSTTFQIQFNEGGEWSDLTWDMISDKPFETLDDTVFIVDENGVLTITDVPTVCSWGDVSDKPFIFLDPDDFSVSASGVLSYTGNMDWSDIIGKPFSTLDNNDFEVQNGKLSVKHQIIPNQTWSQIQNKPFTSLDPTNFQVVGGVLYLNLNPEIPTWSNVQNKPFTYLDSDDFAVVGDTLKVKHQTIPDPEWNDVQNKPFSSLDANDFSVDAQGKATVNFPTPDWDDVTDKPFETLNGSDFSVDADGEMSVNFPTPTPDDWDDVTNKPFKTLGSDFSVDVDGEMSVNFPTPTHDDWDDITSKPFESLGSGLSVDADGVLSASGGGNPDWSDITSKPFNAIGTSGTSLYVWDGELISRGVTFMFAQLPFANRIATIPDLRNFPLNFIVNSLLNRFGLLNNPVTGTYGLFMDECTCLNRINLAVDNTALSGYSTNYMVMTKTSYKKVWSYSGYDEFHLIAEIYSFPDYTDANKLLNIYLPIGIRLNKVDGVYDGTYTITYKVDCKKYEVTSYTFA